MPPDPTHKALPGNHNPHFTLTRNHHMGLRETVEERSAVRMLELPRRLSHVQHSENRDKTPPHLHSPLNSPLQSGKCTHTAGAGSRSLFTGHIWTTDAQAHSLTKSVAESGMSILPTAISSGWLNRLKNLRSDAGLASTTAPPKSIRPILWKILGADETGTCPLRPTQGNQNGERAGRRGSAEETRIDTPRASGSGHLTGISVGLITLK